MIRVLHMFPLFGFMLLFYWFMCETGFFPENLNTIVFSITLPSEVVWYPTWGDLVVIAGVFLLYFELYKATQTGQTSILDHMLSTLVLIAYLVVWLIYPWGGNSVFLVLSMMALLDVVAGFTITISTARRDLNLGGR